MKYELNTYEQNGYHDSYFYVNYYDSDTDSIDSAMFGATAFPSPHNPPRDVYSVPTLEVVERARELLEERTLAYIVRHWWNCRRLSYKAGNYGDTVTLVKNHSNRVKPQKDCPNCKGTGAWVNPKNEEDKRQCFKCNGTGKVADYLSEEKAKTSLFVKGLTGKIVDWKKFRDQVTYIIKLEDGTLMRAPTEKLQRVLEPINLLEAREAAKNSSYGLDFGSHAWLSDNLALKVYRESK